MGILNVTPDSFSDGGKYMNSRHAVERATELMYEGADIIDIGGESSGPGSIYVPVEEELRRVLLVIHRVHRRARGKALISIDTYKAEVAMQCILNGADMINDVTALRGDPEMAHIVAETGVPIILMYSKDPTARTTRIKKRYRDVIKTVSDFFEERIDFALRAGIRRGQIIIDPGMGAFISMEPKYSYEILHRLGEFKKFCMPILVGTSRKSFLPGTIEQRLEPTLAANLLAIQNGADIIRVHDVAAHRRLVETLECYTQAA
ncbi:dihydropteroate synthase [Candidatus Peregrinibacteria bacterium]|nr:dihydropteroate synthase [Candidatus Peregrinibacteria bacterium]